MNTLLPTDGCPSCLAMPVHPFAVWAADDAEGIEAHYTCPSCRWTWATCWSRDALTLPCPGCAQCQPANQKARTA